MNARRSLAGQCRYCLRRGRPVYRIGRSGGGTYRRGGRHYLSSICAECARDLMEYAGTHAGATAYGYSVRDLLDIAPYAEDGQAAVDAWKAKREEYEQARRDASAAAGTD